MSPADKESAESSTISSLFKSTLKDVNPFGEMTISFFAVQTSIAFSILSADISADVSCSQRVLPVTIDVSRCFPACMMAVFEANTAVGLVIAKMPDMASIQTILFFFGFNMFFNLLTIIFSFDALRADAEHPDVNEEEISPISFAYVFFSSLVNIVITRSSQDNSHKLKNSFTKSFMIGLNQYIMLMKLAIFLKRISFRL